MAPAEHIEWFEENVAWFERLNSADLGLEVPGCPGWRVGDVLNHLSFGLGLAYPAALAKPPETVSRDAFADVDWPTTYPRGRAALDAFRTNMRRCLDLFRAVVPDAPCWTYDGGGTAQFWFRRAAIETSLHRIDVAEALSTGTERLDDRRARDAIVETLEFALPFAAELTSWPTGRILIDSPCFATSPEVGSGEQIATITGQPHDILCALWGRHRDRVSVSGNLQIVDPWFELINVAFAGR